MSALAANVPGMRIAVTDVAVNFEKLGSGEPLLGMSTTKFRVTQDYKLAMKVAIMNRNSSEHIVQEYWMADQKSGFANPFARMGGMRPGGGAFAELMTKTAEATARMGNGIPVKTITTTTSTNDKGEKTTKRRHDGGDGAEGGQRRRRAARRAERLSGHGHRRADEGDGRAEPSGASTSRAERTACRRSARRQRLAGQGGGQEIG
jgi:hypothetical protein